jgi:hypothetical protein
MVPLPILRLLPRFILNSYANRARIKLHLVEEEADKVSRLLDDVEREYEYTEGFREHLSRRLEDCYIERFELIHRLNDVEPMLCAKG